ncbi:tail assembly chaperone [Lactiplantibacillus paraxiangfangensis]|uniref:tail assembly chaperone n=1 Tax=Lactiplantibacillus paraxiangfangensis TaxID=3076224 RepID=UPI0030C67212
MLKVKIAGKDVEVKFDFKAFFKANKELSQNGGQDGAAQLWLQFVTGDVMAPYNALCILLPKSYKDDQVKDALDDYMDAGKYDEFVDDLTAELKASGFFHKAAQNMVDQIDKYGQTNPTKDQTAAEKKRTEAVADMLAAMKKSLS